MICTGCLPVSKFAPEPTRPAGRRRFSTSGSARGSSRFRPFARSIVRNLHAVPRRKCCRFYRQPEMQSNLCPISGWLSCPNSGHDCRTLCLPPRNRGFQFRCNSTLLLPMRGEQVAKTLFLGLRFRVEQRFKSDPEWNEFHVPAMSQIDTGRKSMRFEIRLSIKSGCPSPDLATWAVSRFRQSWMPAHLYKLSLRQAPRCATAAARIY